VCSSDLGGVQISNISQLFGSYPDVLVGETPAIIGTAGLTTGGTGQVGAARYGQAYPGGAAAATQAAAIGGTAGRAMNLQGDEPEIVRLLRLLINDIYEPGSDEPVSRMIYVPHTNQLIVHNTPSNLSKLEKQLQELDITPTQVSIEAKFVTIKTQDLKKIGFKWSGTQSDQNNRPAQIPLLAAQTYQYDINGDGVLETIPFYQRPNGTQVIANTISKGVLDALTSPGPAGAFSLSGIITNNADGDNLSVTLDYLNQLEESELLSAPRVTTMNRKPAVIADLSTEWFVGEVYTQLVTTGAGLGVTGSTGFTEYKTPVPFNFGITLSVTPQISGSDQVRLWLNPQVTTRGIEKSFDQTSVINGVEIHDTITRPNTSTQAVWTNVIVHDGDTLVLGGLVSDQTVKAKHKLPYLADIPLLGFFFRGKSKQANQSSLLIFVTPTIIDTTGARFFEAGTMTTRGLKKAPAKSGQSAEASPVSESAEAEPSLETPSGAPSKAPEKAPPKSSGETGAEAIAPSPAAKL
jgi:type II secretory pathway component GspD/PulD (secretin)